MDADVSGVDAAEAVVTVEVVEAVGGEEAILPWPLITIPMPNGVSSLIIIRRRLVSCSININSRSVTLRVSHPMLDWVDRTRAAVRLMTLGKKCPRNALIAEGISLRGEMDRVFFM